MWLLNLILAVLSNDVLKLWSFGYLSFGVLRFSKQKKKPFKFVLIILCSFFFTTKSINTNHCMICNPYIAWKLMPLFQLYMRRQFYTHRTSTKFRKNIVKITNNETIHPECMHVACRMLSFPWMQWKRVSVWKWGLHWRFPALRWNLSLQWSFRWEELQWDYK